MNKSVVSMLLAAVTVPALAAESAPADRLISCADIRDSGERLACFDREAAPLVSAKSGTLHPPSPPPAGRVPAPNSETTPAQLPAPPKPTFGDEQLAPRSRATPLEADQVLHAHIERLRTVSASDFIVYLDNGQAWRHQDVSLGGYLREGEAVTIGKAALGSYRLTRDAGKSKNWIRVTRIR